MSTDKVCTRCGVLRPAEAFYSSQRSADGLAAQCRDCSAKRQRERRERVRNMEPVAVDSRRSFYLVPEVASILRAID